MNRIAALAATVFLGGCAGLADGTDALVGIGSISAEKSTFSGAYEVRMQPAWVYGGDFFGVSMVKLGASWTAENAETVYLVMMVNSSTQSSLVYAGLEGLQINLNGQIHSFKAGAGTSMSSSPYNTVTRQIYTQSKNAVAVPLSLVREMVSSEHCKIRFITSAGYQEADFSIERSEAGGAGARHYMREFLQKIDAVSSGAQA
ncbi:hypothetical protein [Hyphomicrobium sp. D-2]|uniref:hypothetical protein n=1 Tax=Hyphomicrobium sp. D-2 TaxID=3041621 RepID=UPI002453C9CB|nr:hypothetical protein [Hyphomicrobium sp. D-2]MDH4981250.1 hypothetical protein [Hyphomicrobium sp. D-2]